MSQCTRVGQAERPETEIRGRVRNRAEYELNTLQRLMHHNLAKFELLAMAVTMAVTMAVPAGVNEAAVIVARLGLVDSDRPAASVRNLGQCINRWKGVSNQPNDNDRWDVHVLRALFVAVE